LFIEPPVVSVVAASAKATPFSATYRVRAAYGVTRDGIGQGFSSSPRLVTIVSLPG